MERIRIRSSLLLALSLVIAPAALADYETAVKVYLDVGAGAANDTRFDFTSAINRPDDDPDDANDDPADGQCVHLRDFAFNCGFYDSADVDGPGAGTDRFICSASNTTGRANSFPKNPARDPIAIGTSGWYTLRHTFRDDGGVLAVDLEILDSSDTVLNTWTLSDPADVIGVYVGGNRYGWFPSNESFVVAAIDDSRRCAGGCPFDQDFESDASGWFTPTQVSSGTDGIPSAGGSFHAALAGGDFTRWGGYTCSFTVAAIPAARPAGLVLLGMLLLGGLSALVILRERLTPAGS